MKSAKSGYYHSAQRNMNFAFEVISKVREEEPDIFDAEMKSQIVDMISEAVDCETQFAEDLLSGGVAGLSLKEMRQYLEFVADQRLQILDLPRMYNSKNPFPFMDLQDVQELASFFERCVSAYQVAVTGSVVFNKAF